MRYMYRETGKLVYYIGTLFMYVQKSHKMYEWSVINLRCVSFNPRNKSEILVGEKCVHMILASILCLLLCRV